MFYEVKVLDPKGNLKQVISANELRQTHWQNFREMEEKNQLTTTGRARVPRWVKDRLDVEFPDLVTAGMPS
jgi:hypothetical protein